jgi:hypothetical protein
MFRGRIFRKRINLLIIWRGLVASILRFHTFFVTNSFTDGTYDAVELIIWTVAEPGIYLISACLLTYRPLLERVRKSRILGGLRSSGKNSESANYGPGQNRADGSEGRAIPLRGINRLGHGFAELYDEESSGTVHILRNSTEDSQPRIDGGITVTTEIQNSWTAR